MSNQDDWAMKLARDLRIAINNRGMLYDKQMADIIRRHAAADDWADAAFRACCYLDKAVPTTGMTNAERIRFAADEIVRLRAELAKLREDLRMVHEQWRREARAADAARKAQP